MLEIKNGGYPQIDLFNRMILNSISKLQQALNSRDFDDLPFTYLPAGAGSANVTASTKSSSALLQNDMPLISSFFPFTRNTTNSNDLSDLLTTSTDLLAEGSIFDGLSVQQGQD